MAIETVTLLVGRSWKLLSAAASGPFEAYVRSGQAQFFIGDTAPAADYAFGLSRSSVSYQSLGAKVWARTPDLVAVSCMRTVNAGNLPEFMLAALTFSATSFGASLAADAEIATIAGRVSGDRIEGLSPNDGRVVLSADGTKLLRGTGAIEAGSISVIVTRSHPDAPNSPRETELILTVTADAAVPPADHRWIENAYLTAALAA